jgi:hypothetical protein
MCTVSSDSGGSDARRYSSWWYSSTSAWWRGHGGQMAGAAGSKSACFHGWAAPRAPRAVEPCQQWLLGVLGTQRPPAAARTCHALSSNSGA